MSLHGWTADAPTGVYKNHKLSAKIRMASIAETKFMQFTRPEPGVVVIIIIIVVVVVVHTNLIAK